MLRSAPRVLLAGRIPRSPAPSPPQSQQNVAPPPRHERSRRRRPQHGPRHQLESPRRRRPSPPPLGPGPRSRILRHGPFGTVLARTVVGPSRQRPRRLREWHGNIGPNGGARMDGPAHTTTAHPHLQPCRQQQLPHTHHNSASSRSDSHRLHVIQHQRRRQFHSNTIANRELIMERRRTPIATRNNRQCCQCTHGCSKRITPSHRIGKQESCRIQCIHPNTSIISIATTIITRTRYGLS
mmetsp:Transcript_20186/g.57311  ORF Transcript_20186/g.57311 Transcript_20186/m.57311 type:complete len:239 (+) Transcript_20186:450-1166(+)